MIKEKYEFICDVCGKEVEFTKFSSMNLTPVNRTAHSRANGGPSRLVDFCPDCYSRLIKPIFAKVD